MPVSEKWAYFDHAAVGPLPRPSQQKIEQWLKQAVFEGDTQWLDWKANADELRQCGAELLNCRTSEIAIIPNTSTGICIVAEGLRLEKGDNIVFFENEFPSNALPWMNLDRKGVEIRRLPAEVDQSIDLERLHGAIDRRTKLVAVSWVGYASGYRADLRRLCEIVKNTDALLLLDAIQGLGVYPLDVAKLPFDFVIADGHKWMLGPEGCGIAYLRQESLRHLDPILVGWGSTRDSMSFTASELDLKPNAQRYEIGSANMVGIAGMSASLRMLLSLGCAKQDNLIAANIQSSSHWLIDALRSINATIASPLNPKHQSGIVAFDLPGRDPNAFRQFALNHGVALSVRKGHIRVSIHGYNDTSDLERLFEVAQSFLRHSE